MFIIAALSTGKIIRQIRISKGIKSIEIYSNLLSRSDFYKYENGFCETTAENFLNIINKLNISLDEFNSIYRKQNKQLSEFHNLRDEMMDCFKVQDVCTLKKIYKKALKFYNNYNLLCFYHLSQLTSIMIKKTSFESLNFQKEATIIIEYLKNNKLWNSYEYNLFDEFLLIFDCSIFKEAKSLFFQVKVNSLNRNTPSLETIKVKSIYHIVCLMLLENNVDSAEMWIKTLEKVIISPTNVPANCYKKFAVSLFSITINNNFESGVLEITKALTLCENFGLEYISEDFFNKLYHFI